MQTHTRFKTSAVDASRFPIIPYGGGAPEIAFLGRSNVGKSSLLNSLTAAKVAHVSNTPGRTQTINFYEVFKSKPEPETVPDLIFADLPGYGYARVPRAIVGEWPKFIEPYLSDRASLRLCICLIDSNIPPQKSDQQLIEWLRSHGRELMLVATKTDKLSGNKLKVQMTKLADAYGMELLPYSVKSGKGRKELWQAIWKSATAP